MSNQWNGAGIRLITMLAATLALGISACTSGDSPTQPETVGEPTPAGPAFALASNTWTRKAPYLGEGLTFRSAGVAPNSAGQSIVYIFGGRDQGGGTGFGVQAYNVATNTWTFKTSRVSLFAMNGVGKIGNKFYLSGGYHFVETPPSFSNQLLAYDYAQDRIISKANLPIFSAEGETGVINGKLYVLPGACSGELYPQPGYCAEEPTRRFFRYDPTTNTWITRRPAPHFHRDGAGGVINGKFYVAGGPGADLDVYDPVTNTWSTLAPMPVASSGRGAVLGNKLWVISPSGGRLQVYNPLTNNWATKAPPTLSHDALVQVTLDGLFYLLAVGGAQPGGTFDLPNDSELYTR
jgi:hypothetical protein